MLRNREKWCRLRKTAQLNSPVLWESLLFYLLGQQGHHLPALFLQPLHLGQHLHKTVIQCCEIIWNYFVWSPNYLRIRDDQFNKDLDILNKFFKLIFGTTTHSSRRSSPDCGSARYWSAAYWSDSLTWTGMAYHYHDVAWRILLYPDTKWRILKASSH